MRIKEGFVLRDVCGDQVIMGEGLDVINFGRLLCLNTTAAWLWQRADEMGDFSIEALSEKLCEHYDVDAATAQHDVADIVGEWKKAGIIED
ncbi:MAG: PqqD family protein [Prevotella sp.]|jgi:hypothetical protein